MKEFETDSFRMKISDDFIKEITIKKNVSFKVEDVVESIRLSSNAFKPGTHFYVLLEFEEGAKVTNEAKRMVASEDYKNYTLALAMCSKNLAFAIAGNLFLKINKPKIPTRFFENKNDALAWFKLFSNK